MKKIFLFLLCFFYVIAFQSSTYAIANISLPTSDSEFIDTILGEGVTTSNLKLIGEDVQKGIFSGAESILGFDNGIVISTGDVTNIFSPSSFLLDTGHYTAGDLDLDNLVSGNTNDASSIEFDTIPTNNKLSFKYVFASEEFDQSIAFNDVFALYVNGSNIAYLPNTTTTVTIQSVKNSIGNHIDNSSGTNLAFLGYTKVFNCEADVIPGETVHVKIAIADIADCSYDSAVFIKADSLKYSAADAPFIKNSQENYNIGEDLIVNMEESGTIYLVPNGDYNYSTDVINLENVLSYTYNENEDLIIDTSILTEGEYLIYLVDNDGVLSEPSNVIIISNPKIHIDNNIDIKDKTPKTGALNILQYLLIAIPSIGIVILNKKFVA